MSVKSDVPSDVKSDVRRLVLATGNAGKLREMQALLQGSAVQVLSQAAFATPEAEETGLSFVENALIKARHACRHSGLPAIADDSGLAVDALSGAPGIYSARYAGPGASDSENNARLLQALLPLRASGQPLLARFICALVFMRHAEDPVPLICVGQWQGEILSAPQGQNGFGYDPLFYVREHGCSSAELSPEVKNRISHRAQAMRLLQQQMAEQ